MLVFGRKWRSWGPVNERLSRRVEELECRVQELLRALEEPQRAGKRQAVRIMGAVNVSLNGTVSQDEDTIPTKVEVMPGKRWLRIEPQQ